jgi:hypothetical protein
MQMDKILNYRCHFSVLANNDMLINDKQIKEYIAANIGQDLCKWLLENDYIDYDVINKFNGLNNVEGRIELKFKETSRKYKKEILIEKI